MKSHGKSKIILVITLGIFFSLLLLVTFNPSQNSPDHDNLQNWSVSGKIHIEDGLAWIDAKVEGIVTGVGTYSDPFVIEDLIIDAGGSGSGILIENSFIYVRIENCTIYNGDTGIYLFNSLNTLILRNNVSNNNFGIRSIYSENFTILGNKAYNNEYYGISLGSSSEINVIGNEANHNNYAGIHLEDSIGINISGNTANHNNYLDWSMGIALTSSNRTIVSGNTLSDNRQSGIILYNSNNNTIQFNVIKQSDIGIYLAYSYNNEISSNYFGSNNADIIEHIELESLTEVLVIVIGIIAIIALPGMLIFKRIRIFKPVYEDQRVVNK